MNKQIMYIEHKGNEVFGPARIGLVTLSKTGRPISYNDKKFEKISGGSGKANYFDIETGEEYWISGCHKDGNDALYSTVVEIDDDVREEYWTKIRNKPENVNIGKMKITGKYKK